jgi:hypothetical protein
MLVQPSTIVTAIAAIPRTIPIMPEIPILPVAFLNRNVPAIPSRMAPIANMMVRIPHERIPRRKLTIPSQFLVRFSAAAGAGAAVMTGGWMGVGGTGAGRASGEGTNGKGAGCAADCAACCRRVRGFPQFLQNWLESGFWVPHSPQNMGHPRAVLKDIRILVSMYGW